jgi:hypothetical protein
MLCCPPKAARSSQLAALQQDAAQTSSVDHLIFCWLQEGQNLLAGLT